MRTTIKLALVGAGRSGGDVPLRAHTDRQRFDIAGQLVHTRVAACSES